MPCASVSANRDGTNVERVNPSIGERFYGKRVERLAELVQGPAAMRGLHGRGHHTESGIPDFRSRTGIWAKYDPMEYATIDAFLADPAKVWDFYAGRLEVLGTPSRTTGIGRSQSSRAEAGSAR